jgi:DNA-binding phage protein
MLSFEEVQKRLKDRKISVVAEETGLSRPTLYKVMAAKDPGQIAYSTIQTISSYFEKQEAGEQ